MGNTIGERIRQFRLLNNLSQENVAEELNMSNGNYGKIERGEIDISSSHLISLAHLFKIEVGEFFQTRIPTFNDPGNKIGFITNEEFNKLAATVQRLTLEMEKLNKQPMTPKKSLVTYKTARKKKK